MRLQCHPSVVARAFDSVQAPGRLNCASGMPGSVKKTRLAEMYHFVSRLRKGMNKHTAYFSST